MSLLSKYLRSLRTRRNLTDLKLAQRANIELTEYRDIENNPEKVPLSLLHKIFKAFGITADEFEEFNFIAHSLLFKPRGPLQPPSITVETDETNVLEFKSKIGLNDRRKKKKLTKDSGND